MLVRPTIKQPSSWEFTEHESAIMPYYYYCEPNFTYIQCLHSRLDVTEFIYKGLSSHSI